MRSVMFQASNFDRVYDSLLSCAIERLVLFLIDSIKPVNLKSPFSSLCLGLLASYCLVSYLIS